MAAKLLRVSEDDTTYYTLPGNTASINFEGTDLTDSIFGAEFESTQPGLRSWTVSGNALYKGFAGYRSAIKKTGTTTSFTSEAMNQVDSTQTYEIDDSTKSVWDWTEEVTVYDDGTEVDSDDIEEINYLFGEVTFVDSYTVAGPVTVDGNSLPLETFGRANEFTLSQSADQTETSDFETAQDNGGWATFRPTLLNSDLELGAFYRADNNFFQLLNDEDQFIIDIDPAGDGKSVARGIYRVLSDSQDGDVGGDETSSVNFSLSVPEDVRPFAWKHTSDTTLAQGLRLLVEKLLAREEIWVEYLPEGADEQGYRGKAIVVDSSLSSGVSDLIEATVELQGTGAPEVINE